MKVLLLLSTLWTMQATAQSLICPSVYLVQTYKTCSHASHGPDNSRPKSDPVFLELESEWLRGGQNQQYVCEAVRNKYEFANRTFGATAFLHSQTPIRERSEKEFGIVRYKYTCSLSVTQYSPKVMQSPACGASEEDYMVFRADMLNTYKANFPNRVAKVSCLTCDENVDIPLEQLVDCLRSNSKLILTSENEKLKSVEQAQLATAVLQMQRMVQVVGGVRNLQTREQITPFIDILRRYRQGGLDR